MKKLIGKIMSHATSKKVLWIIMLGFVAFSVYVLYLEKLGMDTSGLQFFFGKWVNLVMIELLLYSGKATLEKTKFVDSTINKLTESIGLDITTNGTLETVADELNGKK
jgi:hypothetical protein